MVWTLCSPVAVSIIGNTAVPAPMHDTLNTSSMRSVLGSMMPATPGSRASARSSLNQGVSAALIRTITRWWAASQAATAWRASVLFSGGTASSRSMTTASAPQASALSKRSGRFAGTKRKERWGSVMVSPVSSP